MKIGDAVKIKTHAFNWDVTEVSQLEPGTVGVIVGFDGTDPVVFWNLDFPEEIEYSEQLEVISESR